MEQNESTTQSSRAWEDMFAGQWKQMRGTLRSWWGKITDDDWERIAGHKDRLLGFLQEKYGYTKDMAQRETERRFQEYNNWGSSMGQNRQTSSYDSPQEIKQAGKEMSQKAGEVYNDVKARAQQYGSTAAEKLGEASTAVGEQMSSMANSLRGNAPAEGMMGSAAKSVAESLDSAGSYLQENTFENMARDLTNFIRRYPVQSLLVGFGIGYLLSRRSER